MSLSIMTPVGLIAAVERVFPGAEIMEVRPLAPGAAEAGAATKVAGYGEPVKVKLRLAGGVTREVVWHTARPDVFGHDRRADRADEMLLAYDTFGQIPRHAVPLDVGAVVPGGRLVSLAEAGEFYLITSWVPGRPYADDLRRIAEEGRATALDEVRCDALARYLAALHARRLQEPARYRRSVRDLIGHGEGIFGMIDGYPGDTPGAPPGRLAELERAALAWRWRLRAHEGRLARIHGDFHPFNVLFGDGAELGLVDASRGCAGDPADDVTAMAVNYVFFAVDRPRAWPALGALWRRFLRGYLDATKDDALLDVAPPYLAWRGLVVASPRFYPDLPATARDRLLGWIEEVLAAPRLDPESVERVFR